VALSTFHCVFLPCPPISIGRSRQNLVLPCFFSLFLPSYTGHVCCVWLIDGFQILTNVKLLAEEFQLQILDSTSDSYFCILLLLQKFGRKVFQNLIHNKRLLLLTRIIIHMLR
jgi:hypothetical protein